MSASCGIALAPVDGTSCAELLEVADERMYLHKTEHGRSSARRRAVHVLEQVVREQRSDLIECGEEVRSAPGEDRYASASQTEMTRAPTTVCVRGRWRWIVPRSFLQTLGEGARPVPATRS